MQNCDLGGPAVVGTALAVPCMHGDLAIVDIATGLVLKRIAVADDGVAGVAQGPVGLVVASSGGTVSTLDIGTGTFTPIGHTASPPFTTAVAQAPDGSAVLPVGLGTGVGTSTAVFNRIRTSWQMQVFAKVSLLDPDTPTSAAAASADAFSADGRTMAIGYVDGIVVMSDRIEPYPFREVRDVPGRLRAAITLGDKLIVASSEGVVQEIDWRTDLTTYKGAVDEARHRLAEARAAGLSN